MQAQQTHYGEPIEETLSLNENTDTVVFHTKGKLTRLLKILASFINVLFKVLVILVMLLSVCLLLTALLTHAPRSWEYFWGAVPVLLGNLLLMAYVTKKLNGPALHPVLTLSPDGLTLKADPALGTLRTDPFLGMILWEEIADITSARFLGRSCLRLTLSDEAAFRNRIGKKARYLWTYKIPGGGLGLSSDLFGLSPDDLAARINRYRERGL